MKRNVVGRSDENVKERRIEVMAVGGIIQTSGGKGHWLILGYKESI